MKEKNKIMMLWIIGIITYALGIAVNNWFLVITMGVFGYITGQACAMAEDFKEAQE